jgi:hypothetical protein
MTVTKETIPLQGTLRGEGRERTCRLKALQYATYADECSRPTCLSYSRCSIEDGDDFPDGEYVLEFDGRRVLLTKQAGKYILSSSPETTPCPEALLH